jgi:hypothetical protein
MTASGEFAKAERVATASDGGQMRVTAGPVQKRMNNIHQLNSNAVLRLKPL